MNISAKTVVAKMEQELGQVRKHINTGSSADIREHVTALRTYCDLLLATESSSEAAKSDASAMDILERQRMMGDLDDDKSSAPRQPKRSAYDDDDKPDSDSLFDF
ncbi:MULTISPECIES: DUF5327 family protein [Alteribacter]|uniref:YwdI family protein n=1 Tax=Alteribacter keqinensis TaxID=2483800 RepID=A0A3M7TSB3_9BACI|nr:MULTISPECIES: DUF5327 family protein [Alteribacter]MBM7095519.1 YwdI family protein [Alteribacter salitolerans]RNA67880.1 hypothetical protein EBO34_14350 [Alteribacter keqinensis]